MAVVNVFVEGKTDKEFFSALIDFHFDYVRANFVVLNGDYKRLAEHGDRLKEGKLNLIILDADCNSYENVLNVLQPCIEEESASGRMLLHETYLIKNNLEDLIRAISPEEKLVLWDCIDQYCKCNQAAKLSGLRKIGTKTKVYIYVNAHDFEENTKQKYYISPEIWDLNHNSLQSLLEFLKANITS